MEKKAKTGFAATGQISRLDPRAARLLFLAPL
jgi:hypothetical protein